MKRNATNNREPRSGQSSYARHRKKPYQYSEPYQNWRKARDEADARRLARIHDEYLARMT
jgi:hypothetical protein